MVSFLVGPPMSASGAVATNIIAIGLAPAFAHSAPKRPPAAVAAPFKKIVDSALRACEL